MHCIEILIELGLLDWPTLRTGLENGWVKESDVVDFAQEQLTLGCERDTIVLIAADSTLDRSAIMELLSNLPESQSREVSLDKWRLAKLIVLSRSEMDTQSQLEKLDEIYAEFGYPQDMASCSRYSQDSTCPLIAMNNVITSLKQSLCQTTVIERS